MNLSIQIQGIGGPNRPRLIEAVTAEAIARARTDSARANQAPDGANDPAIPAGPPLANPPSPR